MSGSAPRDARDAEALDHCAFEKSGHDAIGDGCATTAHPIDLDRLDAALVSLDTATRDKIIAQWKKGRALGLAPDVVGLVGDSITASAKFMGARDFVLSTEVAERLRIGNESIVDVHKGSWRRFLKTAKVGASSAWAMPAHLAPMHSRLASMVRAHQPSIVVLKFGSNDATTRFVALDALRAQFRQRMTRILDYLDEAGVVVIMNTVVRHMHDPARPRCDAQEGDLSNWRLAVQTSAVSAVAAAIACERHLPLIDLRHAFDALLNHGIGPDGVHPNAHPQGAGKLDSDGLRCGYNVRNYVTLRMLREVRAVITSP